MRRSDYQVSGGKLRGWVYFLSAGFFVVLCMVVFAGVFRRADVMVKDAKVNLLLLDSMSIASIDTYQNDLTLLKLPDDFLLDILGGRGKYPVRSVVKLLEDEKDGFSYLADSLSISLGLGVDGWIDTRGSEFLYMEDGGLKRAGPISLVSTLISHSSSLDLVDRLKLFVFLVSLPQTDLEAVRDTSALFEGITEPDGEKYLAVNKVASTDLFRRLGADRRLLGEKLSVEIINTTDFPNLAREVGRVVRNASVRVVGETSSEGGDDDREQFRCRIQASTERLGSVTIAKIRRWFGCDVVQWDKKEKSEVQLLIGRGFAIYLRGM